MHLGTAEHHGASMSKQAPIEHMNMSVHVLFVHFVSLNMLCALNPPLQGLRPQLTLLSLLRNESDSAVIVNSLDILRLFVERTLDQRFLTNTVIICNAHC